MKQLLLVALLFTLSITVSAQDTFVKKYTSYISKSKGVLEPWVYSEVTVVFNANSLRDVAFYYPNGKTRVLHQITGATEGKTLNGDGFQMIDCIDPDGTKITLQLFDDDTCLRINIAEGYSIEFHKN
jgi:hypothetical protein